MPASLQIDNTSITTWEDLTGNVKRSALVFARDSPTADPYMQVSMGNSAGAIRVTNLATPTTDSDATNKAYVDAMIQGLTIKPPVRVVAVTAGALETAYAAGETVDGTTLVAGNRILLSAQTDATQNGIYVVAASGAPTRAADMPSGLACSGIYVFVDEGATYMDRSFVCVSNRGSDVVGTHPLEWVQFGARPVAYKGFGLKLGTANALDVDPVVIPVLANNQTFTGNNTFGGTVTVSGTVSAPRVTNLTTAQITANGDAVNLEYLNTALSTTVNGQQAKSAARYALTTNVDVATLATGSVVGAVTLATGDRILLVAQTAGAENGLYVVNATAPATRTADMPVGASARGSVVAVARGDAQSRLYLCVAGDLVGTDALTFLPVGHTLTAMAGTALTGNLTDLRLDVRTDDVTIETDGTQNQLRLRDLGITNAKIANATVANAKLVNPQVNVKVLRGLRRTTTDGTTTSAPVTDTSGAADLGLTVPLGANVGVEPDFTVVPDLAASNTFTAANTFSNTVAITSTTASTSQSSGALTVSGGVGVSGDVYCANTYNMSDERLKTNVTALGEDAALQAISAIRGVTFQWTERMPGREGQSAVGVIAQEVKEVAPLAVRHDAETDLYAVEYTRLVPYLVEAVKSLKRRCEDLDAEVKRLRTV